MKQLVDLALAFSRSFKQVICIAHNGQSYDTQFLFKYLTENHAERVKPQVILNGSKIILMQYLNIKFLDSLLYLHLPLSGLPKAYGLPDIQKGYFCHFFNTPENQNYCGPMPPAATYGPDSMSVEERSKFLTWYEEQVNNGYVFNFQEEIVKYCKQDVEILRRACLAFRENFMTFDVDPFAECTTIASTCMRVYRKKFLKKNQIGIVPSGGYRMTYKQSVKGIQWLYWMEKRVLLRPVDSAIRSRETRLPEGMLVDGYCQPLQNANHRGIVLQFHGCFWHGCPRCFRINRDVKLTSGDTLDARYERTVSITGKIKASNYMLIEKWECDYDRGLKENDAMKRFIVENDDVFGKKRLNVRDCFFGGRTGNDVKLYDCKPGEKIHYDDVISLYPEQCMFGMYPVGHPVIYVGKQECCSVLGSDYHDISKVDGILSVTVLPPRNLIHAVLPVRMHNKLHFPLCRTCCEETEQRECPHDDEKDRVLHGTWISLELQLAVVMGYVIKEVHEIWQYKMTCYDTRPGTGGLFAGYIKDFFKQKTLGFPPECVSEENKDRYVQSFKDQMGIDLPKDEIRYNAGLRSVSKISLNSLWGKTGQRENLGTTEVITEAERLTELLNSAEVIVNSVLPVNDEILYVDWCFRDEAYTPTGTTSIPIAAYTTCQARIKLYRFLNALGSRVLYYDTDSVIYVTRPGESKVETGSTLGALSDELQAMDATHIESFVSGGSKFYCFKYRKTDGSLGYVCKVKGFRLNYTNKQEINYDSIRRMVTDERSEIVVSSSAIRRTRFHDVVTVPETKTCKPVYAKRRFVVHDESYPYGYKRPPSGD